MIVNSVANSIPTPISDNKSSNPSNISSDKQSLITPKLYHQITKHEQEQHCMCIIVYLIFVCVYLNFVCVFIFQSEICVVFRLKTRVFFV